MIFINSKKKKIIVIILLFIVITGVLFIWQDFALLFFPKNAFPINGLSNFLKAFIIFLTTLLMFLIGRDCLNPKDAVHMKVIYILIILADFSLVFFRSPMIGVSVFFLVQLNLVIRNSKHLREKIASVNMAKRRILLSYTLLMCLVDLFCILFLVKTLSDQIPLLVTLSLYLLMVSTSLWTALTNFFIGLFPRRNGLSVFIGMFCFLLCDINVGLSWIHPEEAVRLIAASLIWVFYTPALTLIALSGYKSIQ